MNGYIEIDNTWRDIESLNIVDINGVAQLFSMPGGSEYDIRIGSRNTSDTLGAYIWVGDAPTDNDSVTGAGTLIIGERGYLGKGTDSIYVKAINVPTRLLMQRLN